LISTEEQLFSAELKIYSSSKTVLIPFPMTLYICGPVSLTAYCHVQQALQHIGDTAWFMRYAPPKQQPFLVQIDADGNAGSEKIIFDLASGELL